MRNSKLSSAQLQGAKDALQGGAICLPVLRPNSPEAHQSRGAFSNTRIPARFCHVAEAGTGPSPEQPKLGGWGHLKHVVRAIRRGWNWLNNHWIGDVVGLLGLFGGWYAFLLIGWAMS